MMRKFLSAVILVPRLRAGNKSLYAVYESGPEKKLQRLSYLVTTLPKIVEVPESDACKNSLLDVAFISTKCHSVIRLQHSVS